MRLETLREMGATLSPFSTHQLLQGLETLSLRMDKHSSNALALAEYLEQHPAVSWVARASIQFLSAFPLLRCIDVNLVLTFPSISFADPGLKSHPSHAQFKTHLPRGAGGMLAFGLKATATRTSHELARDVVDAAKLAIHAPSVGQAQTLIVRFLSPSLLARRSPTKT